MRLLAVILSAINFSNIIAEMAEIKMNKFTGDVNCQVIIDNSDILVKFFASVKVITIVTTEKDTPTDDPIPEYLIRTLDYHYTYTIFNLPLKKNLLLFPDTLEHEGFVIISQVTTTLQSIDIRQWRRNGVYLVVLLGAKVEEEVVQWLREMWRTIGSVTVLTIFRGLLWRFQPFYPASNSDSFGQIELFQGNPGADGFVNYKRQITRNLHGYPLRLELFESGYYVPLLQVVKGVKSKRKPIQFVGPDKETIDVLKERMNFTGNSFLTPLDN